MNTDRRHFLKSLALAGLSGMGLTGSARGSGAQASAAAPGALGVLVDLTYCVGCCKCEWACERENLGSTREIETYRNASEIQGSRRPDARALTVVNALPHGGDPVHADYVKVQCMHCLDPACASACIVGALHKDPRGPVTYDSGKCIGCRYCMVACPFQIPGYEYDAPLTPRVMKCSLCMQRTLVEGKRPACVELCPEGCLIYGARDELLAYARHRLQERPERYHNHIYGEREAGGCSWLYIADRPLTELGFPALDSIPPGHFTERVQHGIFKNFVPPLALYGFLGALMWMNREREADHD